MTARRPLVRTLLAAAALAVALPLTGCAAVLDLLPIGAPQPERDDTTQEIVEEGQADVFAIRVGDCMNMVDDEVVSEVPVVPCGEPHDEEVYFDFTLDDGEYPGDDAVLEASDTGCFEQFEPFVGLAYESSTLDFYAYRPTAESWAQGDRVVSCVIWDPAGPVTGSLAKAAY
ncbi:septum formation family protein [Agromyces sp. H66]|uniref:septum formation family protein n=1 Tax=Agromyces sp. H66 TaxID=2529859 RepID=UPI0010A9A703|nr:septum formation family protein [Agromyces sp. H66]